MKAFYPMLFAAMIAGQASAQTVEKFNGVSFSKFSADGNWLVENNQGTMNIYNRATDETFNVADPDGMKMFMPGLGNSVTNSGKVVGTCGDYAGIWQNGEWTYLPQATGVGTSYNAANAITPDESRIVGILGNDGASMASDGMMAYPVVWTKNANGEYECEKLPCPEKDFIGATPQYITAIAVSDDGKTVVGQVRDNSGFYLMPILYRQQTDGTWTYTMLAENEVYDKSRLGELPERPGDQPKYPDVAEYMTAADVDDYNDAVDYYNEQLELYYAGVIDTYPDYPVQSDYISDADSKAAYLAAVDKYQADQNKWMADYMAYQQKLGEITTNCSFVQSALCLSGNGRYLGMTLEDRSSSDGWGGSTDKYVGYMDLTAEAPSFVRETKGGDYLITSILNDGVTFVGTPAMEYTRNTFVVVPGDNTNTTMSLPKYMETRNAEMAKWIVDNNTYDVNVWGYDDDWNPIITDVVKDSLVTGTVMANSDGTLYVSYYTDQFSSDDEANTLSYVINLNGTTAVKAVGDDRRQRFGASVSGKSVVAGADTDKMEVFDATGRKVNADDRKRSVALESGIYVVRTTAKNGTTATRKVVVK